MEPKDETRTALEEFTCQVGDALNRTSEDLDSACWHANMEFALEVKRAASKHAMNSEQIDKVLADFAGNEADIATGPGRRLPKLTIIDVLLSAYESVIGEEKANRIYECVHKELRMNAESMD